MREKAMQLLNKEDTKFWLLMNVIIVVAVPIAIMIICRVAECPITLSSAVSDFTLSSFSVLFNIGVYIFGELPLEAPPQDVARNRRNELVDSLVESFVEESREKDPGKLLKELKEKLQDIFQDYLTESSLKKKRKSLEKKYIREQQAYNKRLEEDKRLKRNGISVFLCVAACAFVYGFDFWGKTSILGLIIHAIFITILLFFCARWGIKTLETMRTRK